MLNGLYWESYYGKAMNLKVKDITDKEKKFRILYENQLVGIPRLRQVPPVTETKFKGCRHPIPLLPNLKYLLPAPCSQLFLPGQT